MRQRYFKGDVVVNIVEIAESGVVLVPVHTPGTVWSYRYEVGSHEGVYKTEFANGITLYIDGDEAIPADSTRGKVREEVERYRKGER